MPLWDFNLSPNVLSDSEKASLAKAITKIYTEGGGLPAFYVQIRFTEDNPSSKFVGGEKHTNFVYLQIYHLARTFRSDEHKKAFLRMVDSVLNPVLVPKGSDWEYFVTESPRDLWKINGIYPPPAGSQEEKQWAKLNRPLGEREKL